MKRLSVLAVAAVAASCATSADAFTPKALVTMFSGAQAPPPSTTQQALAIVGQEMAQEFVASDPVQAYVESTVVPYVDGFLHATLDPYAPIVSAITQNENATSDYIEQVDEAVVDAIESTLLNPQDAPKTVQAFNEAVYQPVAQLAEDGVSQIRSNAVETADQRLRRVMAPFRPFVHLMGKDGDVEDWILAIDEALGNVLTLQPYSEEAQALRELRDVLMEPYHRSRFSANQQIDADIDSLDSAGSAGAGGAAPAPPQTPIQRWYSRFWQVRNGLTNTNSISDVLANANAGSDGSAPAFQPTTFFEQPQVTKEHFTAHENKGIKVQTLKNIRSRLQSLLEKVDISSELVEMNPRFLLKNPKWPSKMAAKLREDNPKITQQEIADSLTDMLRMNRMKNQARILANKGCSTAEIEEKLKEFWVDNKEFAIKDVEC